MSLINRQFVSYENWSCMKSASNERLFWFPVFYVQSIARSFRYPTCPLRRTGSLFFTPSPPGIEPRVAVHYTTASPRKLLNIFGHIAMVTRLHNK